MEPTEPSWYGVRCLFRWRRPGDGTRRLYEERTTLWRASSFEEAIAKAEAEAQEYARLDPTLETGPERYLGFADAYRMVDEPNEGAEVFSLLRESGRSRRRYIDRHLATGHELRGEL